MNSSASQTSTQAAGALGHSALRRARAADFRSRAAPLPAHGQTLNSPSKRDDAVAIQRRTQLRVGLEERRRRRMGGVGRCMQTLTHMPAHPRTRTGTRSRGGPLPS